MFTLTNKAKTKHCCFQWVVVFKGKGELTNWQFDWGGRL